MAYCKNEQFTKMLKGRMKLFKGEAPANPTTYIKM